MIISDFNAFWGKCQKEWAVFNIHVNFDTNFTNSTLVYDFSKFMTKSGPIHLILTLDVISHISEWEKYDCAQISHLTAFVIIQNLDQIGIFLQIVVTRNGQKYGCKRLDLLQVYLNPKAVFWLKTESIPPIHQYSLYINNFISHKAEFIKIKCFFNICTNL